MLKLTTLWLRRQVKKAYSTAATKPQSAHVFPVGEAFALSLGYPREVLDRMPSAAKESFTGVSNVSIFAEIPLGSTVLDLGCGAGLDTLIAAQKAGPKGKVIAVDFSVAMLDRARKSAVEVAYRNVEFHEADAEGLPIDDQSVDVVMANGIFNLNPHRKEIFAELARVLRPGGSVFAAELILREPLPSRERRSTRNWLA